MTVKIVNKNKCISMLKQKKSVQNTILILLIIFMCYLISKQLNLLQNRQDLHYKVYRAIHTNKSIIVDDANFMITRDEDFRVWWDEETVDFFHSLLELDKHTKNNKTVNCDLGKEFILTGLPGPDDTLEDYIWQYLSLEALSSHTYTSDNHEELHLKPFLTPTTKNTLNNLFNKITIPTINYVSEKCFDLKYSIIVGNRFPLTINQEPKTTPYLLEQNAKRYVDIVKLNIGELKQDLSFRKSLTDKANQKLLAVKKVFKMNNELDINYVGLYIQAEDNVVIPIEFFRNAMSFHRKLNSNTIFMVLCDEQLVSSFCKDLDQLNPVDFNLHVLKISNETEDFVLMSLCNNTIVFNTIGALHALFNGGETTAVYEPLQDNKRNTFIPFLMSIELPNWYPLG